MTPHKEESGGQVPWKKEHNTTEKQPGLSDDQDLPAYR